MSFNLPYACLANYSPRGSSELSVKSRDVCARVKKGSEKTISSAFVYFDAATMTIFSPFLNADTLLIPVPRSSLLQPDSVWPGLIISNLLVASGHGSQVSTCLQRTRAVPKSSGSYSAESRPSIETQLESLHVEPEMITHRQITLIDDVLTLGRTSIACALKLREAYPQVEIKLFVLLQTKSRISEITQFIEPYVGEITYNPNTGKASRSG
ncbi:phosphoribosyltransferase [Xanthocytophaga agilis]|uniref:Phosphoribosyltransferase n=1 Tax=Xanthocytophaga agilis TaxID=3048010 RepID=A0AAE3UH93_9BACT|nr:phosphoribosyltransferase [Xanthocytophaga agilis]MDJ1505215.1 phosphoribosyltransferase [Xanthocytophaga agilis]